MAVKIAVYIGRFQPFHLGHVQVLTKAFEENDEVIVLIGSSFQAATIKNPFTYYERANMISKWQMPIAADRGDRGASLHIRPLVDYPYNNAKWIEQVQQVVEEAIDKIDERYDVGTPEITLYGSARDSSTWYLSAFPQWQRREVHPYPLNGNLTATSLRDHLFTGDLPHLWQDLPASSMEFITKYVGTDNCHRLLEEYNHITSYKRQFGRGEIDKLIDTYEYIVENDIQVEPKVMLDQLNSLRKSISPYPPVFVTTDCVVVQSGHLLVVERGNLPGKGLWALPGGFLNQNERMLDGAIRELLEETGIRLADGKKAKEITQDILRNSVKNQQVFDHPDRSLRGRTITQAFFFRLDDTKPLPKVKGQNMPLDETGGELVVETAWARWIPISEARAKTEMWFEDHHSIVDTFLG